MRHRGERVRLLEDHADLASDLRGAHVGRVDVLAVELDLAGERRAGTSSCIRFRMRRNVDLPQPDGPISAVTRRATM